jgi:serine/threonine-protein kinase
MDFGAVTRRAANGSPKLTTQVFGTPLSLAPEVLRGEAPSPRADLYSLGALLHHLVSGTHPVEAATMAEPSAPTTSDRAG